MNTKEIKKLIKDTLHTDTIGTKRNGNILCRWGYFYRHGKTNEDFVLKVKELLNRNEINFRIVDSGDNWKPFSGGACIANQSHWFVEVHILTSTK